MALPSLRPHDTLGYKDLDVQLTKNFTFFDRFTAYGRVDVINVFNWKNYDPAAIQVVYTNGVPTSAHYNKTGPIVGAPFTIRLSAGVKFGAPPPRPAVEDLPPPPPPPPPAAASASGDTVVPRVGDRRCSDSPGLAAASGSRRTGRARPLSLAGSERTGRPRKGRPFLLVNSGAWAFVGSPFTVSQAHDEARTERPVRSIAIIGGGTAG